MDFGIDVSSIAGGGIGSVLGIIGLAVFVLIAVGVFMYTLNGKYPKVKFRVIDQGMEKVITQRLMGNKVVSANLIQILMKGDRILGEDINTFDYLNIQKGGRIYYAYLRNEVLVPLRIKETEIDVGEINKARDIAYRYINVLKQTREQTAKNEPLITAIISTIPILIIVIAFGVLVYMLLTGVSEAVIKSSEILKEIAIMNQETLGHVVKP